MPEETPSKHDFTQVVEIAQIQLSHLNNGAHFQFMKNVSDRLATDTKIKENAVGQAAIKALTEALAALSRPTGSATPFLQAIERQ